MDIIEPLTISPGFRYCLTIVNHFTRWPEAHPLVDITAETCADAFISGWVARFSCPETITTDRGRQCVSDLFRRISNVLGAHHQPTTSYHLSSNGMVEGLYRQLKAIMCHTDTSWTEALLLLVLLGIQSAWKEDIASSTVQLVYGKPLRLSGEFFTPLQITENDVTDFVVHLLRHMANLTPTAAVWHSRRMFYVLKALSVADFVYFRRDAARKPLEAPYWALPSVGAAHCPIANRLSSAAFAVRKIRHLTDIYK